MQNKEFRVLLLYPNTRKMSLVPTSLAILASLMRDEGVTVDLFDTSFYQNKGFEDNDEILEKYLFFKPAIDKFKKIVNIDPMASIEAFRLKVDDFKPDLIAVTCVESTFEFAISLLSSIEEKNIPTILGGVFATFSPDRALSHDEIDMVCIGEGEVALLELVKKMRSGEDYFRIRNIYAKDNGQIIRNSMGPLLSLDEIPIGDFEIFDENRFYRAMRGEIYKMAPIETHRGCPNVCTFCNSPLQNKLYKDETGQQYFRKKSIKNVYEQIKYFVDKFNVEYLFFWADNLFAYSLEETKEFCEMYSQFKLPFFCQSYPLTITKEKMELLTSIGLKRLGVGIEHGNEKFRKKVIRRNYSNELAIKNLLMAKTYGIQLSTNNIIGFPDETPELVMDTIELNKAIDPDTASCSVFTPFRGTYLRELAMQKGYLKDLEILAPANSEMSVLDMPRFTRNQIESKRRTFDLYIKFPKSRWKEISLAEQLTPEGDKIWLELSEEFHAAY